MTTTLANTHGATVADIYDAFGAGDLPRLCAHLDPDVSWDADWTDNFAQRAGAELLRARRGPAEVAEFFTVLGGCTVASFAVLDVIAGDRQVVAQIEIDVTLPGGGRHRDQELHLWSFGPDGKVTALRHYLDTAKMIAAAAGEDTTTH